MRRARDSEQSSWASPGHVRSSPINFRKQRHWGRHGMFLRVPDQSFSMMSLVLECGILSGRLVDYPSLFHSFDGKDVPGLQLQRRYRCVGYRRFCGLICRWIVRTVIEKSKIASFSDGRKSLLLVPLLNPEAF